MKVLVSVLGLVLMNRWKLELKDINLLNWISLNWSSNQCFIKVAVAVKTLKEGSSVEEKIDFLSEAEMMKRFVDCHNWHIDCNVLTIIWWQKQCISTKDRYVHLFIVYVLSKIRFTIEHTYLYNYYFKILPQEHRAAAGRLHEVWADPHRHGVHALRRSQNVTFPHIF